MLMFSSLSSYARTLKTGSRKARRRNWSRPNVEQLEVRVLLHANPVMDAEHLAVFGARDAATLVVTGGLVPDAAVTTHTIASGNWSNPAIWSDGVPDEGDNVLISMGTVVTVDGDETVSATDPRVVLRTIRADGALRFEPHVNTKLLVDTIIVEGSGVFEMGTDADPIDATHRARVIFADGTIGLSPAEKTAYDTAQFNWDPLQFSHGLVTHGSVSIHGAHVTSFVSGQKTNLANSSAVDLGFAVPSDWKVGDRLVFGDNTPPNLQLSASMPTTINKADLDNGATFLVDGQLLDDSFGTKHFQQTIKLNDPKFVSALQTHADGTLFVTVTLVVEDFANNKTIVKIDLNVSLTATLLKDIGRKNDPFFVSSKTLLGLIG